VADASRGDPLGQSKNGRSDARNEDGAPTPGAPPDRHMLDVREQDLRDADQTGSETNQTLADADQTSSDADQTSADRDQLAADCDQQASDRDLASGVDPAVHERSRDMRERTSVKREQTAQARLDAADKRDLAGHTRDLAAMARDQAADVRDLAVAQRDASLEQSDGGLGPISGAEIVIRAAGLRKRAARIREQSSEQRMHAARDRESAASDRVEATHERHSALADREALAHQLAVAAIDPLTGAHTRAAGLSDLDGELERCRRTSARLAIAYVDVVGLKALNDSDGHRAGDELLKRVVDLITERLRPYDKVIRLGGDEFLCVMPNVLLAEARERFSQIATTLAARPGNGLISSGFAQLTAGDTATALIARADLELTENRHANPRSRPDPGVGESPTFN
jgi:diguanylate cyclase (GGDEF)-like protein